MPATLQKEQPARPAQAGRRCRLALLGGFAALLFLPGPLWLALRGGLDTSNHENRALAPFPAGQSAPGLQEWPAAFDAWLGDHAPFRNQCMTLNARANWALGSLDSSDVLLGKERWLFLRDVSDSSSLLEYQGLTAYTPEELAACRVTLTALQTALARRGCRLAVVLAPAKEGVYSQYMPDTIPAVSRLTRVQALAAYLQAETDLALLWPQQALRDAAKTQQVYYRYDTHWNEAGAYLAASELLELLGRPALPFEQAEFVPDAAVAAPADLANVSGAWALCTNDVYYTADLPRGSCTLAENGGNITRWQGGGEGGLVLIRDSFGEALAPFLTARFESSLALHGSALAPEELLAQLDALPAFPDVVVLEVAERFADNLARQAALLLPWAEGA